jgi:serine/threonine protein kinase/uncharacterized protein YecT (DUF1311 family)
MHFAQPAAEPMSQEADFPTDLQALERDYDLVRELGHGGMAAVYLARHRATRRLVAIKAIRGRYLDDPEVLRRFAREARTVADLDHPNILRTEAIEQIDDRAVAIIMEYIEGGTVRDRLREYGAFSAEAAEQVLRDVAKALSYAHGRGIVHRDVKPENVFLDPPRGRALLADFGIARRIEGDAPITLLGASLGTPQYMSPEQIDGRRVDGRSDIYSVGVLGWELLTGRRPWAGENLYSIIYKQKHEVLPRITTLRPRVPANLLVAIERALEKDPDRRWQSAEELVAHLAYEPPPVLEQSFPPAAAPRDDEATVRFRREPEWVPDTGAAPVSERAPAERVPARHGGVDAPRATRPESPRRESPRRESPRREAPRREPPRRRVAPSFFRRPAARAVLLIVPLAIALGSLYVVLDLPIFGGDSASGTLTSSGGVVALDSVPAGREVARPPADSVKPNAPAPAAPKPAAPPVRTDSTPASSTTAPRRSDSVPVRRDTVQPIRTADAASGPEPTPRCRVATVVDQRACLLAHIAMNDASLQRVYDSLIVELRREARAPRRSPDPPEVTRLRVEQRAWVVARDRECMRASDRPSTRLWARDRATCFAEKSAVRTDELRARLAATR